MGKKTFSFEKKFFKSLSKNLSFYKGKNCDPIWENRA